MFYFGQENSPSSIVGSVLDKHSCILKRTGKKNGFLQLGSLINVCIKDTFPNVL